MMVCMCVRSTTSSVLIPLVWGASVGGLSLRCLAFTIYNLQFTYCRLHSITAPLPSQTMVAPLAWHHTNYTFTILEACGAGLACSQSTHRVRVRTLCSTAIYWYFSQAALHHSTPTLTNDGCGVGVASHKLYVYHVGSSWGRSGL